jgi:hypothetical protein
VLEDRLLVRAWKRSHRCVQSNLQPEGQVADEAVIPVQDDDQPYNHEEAQRVDSKNSAANAFPERPSTRTTNNASNSLQLQDLGQQSDTGDEAPTRQRTTRTAQPKRAPPAGRKRKKANEIQDTPFYIHLPDSDPKYRPIAALPDSVKATLLKAYNDIGCHRDHVVRL